jgi:hypothetical protein
MSYPKSEMAGGPPGPAPVVVQPTGTLYIQVIGACL